MEQAEEETLDHPPQDLIKFLKEKLDASDESMKFLRLTKLCTLCDIAICGTQDLPTLLESFPMSNHVDEHFQSFVSNMVCIGHCLKIMEPILQYYCLYQLGSVATSLSNSNIWQKIEIKQIIAGFVVP